MRDCKFCDRFWAFVFKYALLIVTFAFAAMCLALYAVPKL